MNVLVGVCTYTWVPNLPNDILYMYLVPEVLKIDYGQLM